MSRKTEVRFAPVDWNQLPQIILHRRVNTRDTRPNGGVIPLAPTSPAMPAPAAGDHDFSRGGAPLLIVDDGQSLRDLLTEASHRRRCTITTTSTGRAATDLTSDASRRLDLNLPDASGLQAMKLMRRGRPGTSAPETRENCPRIGQRERRPKPCTLDEMNRRVRRLLDAGATPRT